MANKGLKYYSNHLQLSLGDICNFSLCLYENNANLFATIPLLKTIGRSPINTSLIFNLLDYNSISDFFGYGFYCNYYLHTEDVGLDDTRVFNPDGSKDIYTYDHSFGNEGSHYKWSFKNPETGATLYRHYYLNSLQYTEYELKDKYDNTIHFSNNSNYPSYIVNRNNEFIYLDFIASTKTIRNTFGDTIYFTKNGNVISRIYYKHYDDELAEVLLSYLDNRITQVTWKQQNTIIYQLSISYNTAYIEFIDEITQKRIKFFIENNKVTSFIQGDDALYSNSHTLTLVYNNTKTILEDEFGKKIYYFFDENGVPLYTLDNKGHATESEFDKTTKELLSKSNVIDLYNSPTNLFPSSLADFTIQNASVVSSEVTQEPFSTFLGNSNYRITPNNNDTAYLTYSVNIDGIATDNLTAVIWGLQITPKTDTSFVEVKLTLLNGTDIVESDLATFNKTVTDGYFALLTLGVDVRKTYTSIKLEITLHSGSIIEIGGLQVIKKAFGTSFEYDGHGNIVSANNNGRSTSVSYDEHNMPKDVVGANSSNYLYVYNSRGNVSQAYSSYGNTLTNEYDTSNPDNVISTLIEKRDGKKILNENVYSDDGRFLISQSDELGNETNYSYDAFGRIIGVTNALNATTSTQYNNDNSIDNLILSFENDSVQSEYTYDSRKRISSVTLSNGSIYSFTYDAHNNISVISLNGITLFTYYYDNSTNDLVGVRYGNNGDAYSFLFYSNHQIKSIHYGLTPTNSNLRFTYNYNEKNELYEIRDKNNNLIKRFYYDDEKRVIKEENSDIKLTKQYNSSNSINNLSIKDNDKTINLLYDSLNRSMGAHPESVMSKYMQNNEQYVGIFSINSSIHSKDFDLNTVDYSNQETTANFIPSFDGAIPYIKIPCNRLFGYNLSSLYQSQTGLINGGVQFWFRGHISHHSVEHNLIVWKSQTGNSLINVYIKNQKIFLKVKDSSDTWLDLLVSDETIDVTKWNFIALSFANDVDPVNNVDLSEYVLNINGKTYKYRKTDGHLDVLIGSNQYLNLGHYSTVPLIFENDYFDITALFVANGRMLKNIEIYTYYRISKDYITDNQLIENDINTVDFSETCLLNVSQQYQNEFEIFPLHNNVSSLKGIRPIKYSIREASPIDKDPAFNFNKLNKRYCYVADGSELSYLFGNSNTGTIVMRVFVDATKDKQCLFELMDNNRKNICLMRDKNLKLYIYYNGTTYPTNLVLSNNEWHTVAMAFRTYTSPFANPATNAKEFRIVVDDQSYLTNFYIEDLEFTDFVLNVGRTYDKHLETISWNLGFNYSYYELYGQIEMLSFNHTYENVQTIHEFGLQIVSDSIIHEFDDIGMHKRTHIMLNDSTLLKHSYSYKTRSDDSYLSRLVASEKIVGSNDNQITDRRYQYDELGQVTKIVDQYFGSKTYAYDYRGYLVNDCGNSIEYDGNGNITKIGTTVLTYDSLIKDRLIAVGGNSITYDGNNFNPIAYLNNTYQYEGRRLIGFNNGGNNLYQYKYDDRGLRIQKIGPNNSITNYFYSDNRLIRQKDNINTIDFLYDENNELFGFILNNSSKFYYIRDILKNILGIVNASGDIVVKYNLDAFGNVISITDNSGFDLGILNPFRYKGYYYDNESGMYYCKSRYYVPNWGRWLNADNPLYLSVDNQISINLFSYCKNNPISNRDEDGHIFISILVGALAVGAITAAASFTVAAIAGLVCQNFDLRKCLCAAAGGFVSGFVGFLLGGGGSLTTLQTFWVGFIDSSTTTAMEMLTDGVLQNPIEFAFETIASGVIGGITNIIGSHYSEQIDSMFFDKNILEFHKTVVQLAFKQKISITDLLRSVFVCNISDLEKAIMPNFVIDVFLKISGELINDDGDEKNCYHILGWCL